MREGCVRVRAGVWRAWMKKRWMKAFSEMRRSSCLVKRHFLKSSFGRLSFIPSDLARLSTVERISLTCASSWSR